MSTSREATDADLGFAQCVACEMTDAMGNAPFDIKFGALSLLCAAMFSTSIKEADRLQAFDDFAKVVRTTIQGSMQ